MQPRITVVMATYKQAKWIADALRSIDSQKGEGLEGDGLRIILVPKTNDTQTWRALRTLPSMSHFIDVRWWGKANMWSQRGHGLDCARYAHEEITIDGKEYSRQITDANSYFCFFDSDDVMLPGWLEKGLKVAEEIKSRGKIPIVGPSYRMVDEKLRPIQDVILPNWTFKGMMEGSIIPDFSITTTEALRSVGGLFDPDWEIPNPGNSYAMFLRLLKKYKDQIEVRLLPDIGFLYRQHKKSMHNRFQSKRRSAENVTRQRLIARHYFPNGVE